MTMIFKRRRLDVVEAKAGMVGRFDEATNDHDEVPRRTFTMVTLNSGSTSAVPELRRRANRNRNARPASFNR